MQTIKDILGHSNKNITSNDIINQLNLKPTKDLISEHGLWGQVHHNTDFILSKKKENQYSNLFFKEQFTKFKQLLTANDHPVIIPLKGISLLNRLYPNLENRKMSDIDVYIPKADKVALDQLLLKHGYIKLDEKKWQANEHKVTYIKKHNFIPITIEVHFKLYYHLSYHPQLDPTHSYLSHEDELIFLCYHLAEQHNFLKLFWLQDIALYINKFNQEINWQIFHQKAQNIGITRSTNTCLFLAHKHLGAQAHFTKKNKYIERFIDWGYLCYPYKIRLKYFLLKYYLKQARAKSYLIHWLISKF